LSDRKPPSGRRAASGVKKEECCRADRSWKRRTSEDGDTLEGVSVGEYLARQRRMRGISVDELSELTRIPRRNLERLESGAFDDQPDGFARGFVRTVALALGLDPDEAVMRLMPEPEEDTLPPETDPRELAARFVVVALLAGIVLLTWKVGSVWLSASGEDEPEAPPPTTFRLDAIGELAREADARSAVAPDARSAVAPDAPSAEAPPPEPPEPEPAPR
jgi:cytoskeletal protein RodZ